MTTRKSKPAKPTAPTAPTAVDTVTVPAAPMAATVMEFIATATSGNPWTPAHVDNSRANVQPELPTFNPNVGVSSHLPTAPTGEAIAPIGETESFRKGRELFTADANTRAVILWCRDAKIAPRAQAEGETAEQYDAYLEKFTPDEEKADEFKRGYARAFCDREGRTLHYIRLDEAGKIRCPTDEEVAAMGTDAQDPRLFTVTSWAAYELSEHAFGKLKGKADRSDEEKGVWAAERKRVKNTADKRFSRVQADAVTADTWGVKAEGSRGNNATPWESLNKFTETLAKSVGRVDRTSSIWLKTELSRVRVALEERVRGFYLKD